MTPGTGGVVAVATHRRAPAATDDDALALSRLATRNPVVVEAVPWDADAGWQRYRAILVRSTWDYHTRLDEFLAWAAGVEASGTLLLNPSAAISWNADKGYLRELENAGVAVVPTAWIPHGSPLTLLDVLRERGWDDVVVKPAVSATAYRTRRVSIEDARTDPEIFGEILRDAGALVQPFLPQIRSDGEWSFVYFDDGRGSLRFSHAVVKRPGPGDFRVQAQFGGTAEEMTPTADLLRRVYAVAATVCRLAPGPLLYARVDGLVSDGRHAPAGSFLLMEVELIEPVLFLAESERAADRFAEAIARKIDAPGGGPG